MPQKKILVLGSGLVAKPCVYYLARDANNELTIGEFTRQCWHWDCLKLIVY